MGDIAERVTAAKKQVEDLRKQLSAAKADKIKGFKGLNKMGMRCIVHLHKSFVFKNLQS